MSKGNLIGSFLAGGGGSGADADAQKWIKPQDIGQYTGLLGDLVNYGRYIGRATKNVKPADFPYSISGDESNTWELEVLPYYNAKPANDSEKVFMIQRLTTFYSRLYGGNILGVYTRSFEFNRNGYTGVTTYFFSYWERTIVQGDINNAASALQAQIDTMAQQIAAFQGQGGYLAAYDFGTDAPTQQQLTDYALAQIGITEPTQIFNGTRVKNLFDGHLWILTNTPATDPAVFDWADDGVDNIDTSQFVLKQSATTQVIDSDIALAKGKKLLGTKASGAEALIAEYAIYNEGEADEVEQVEIGSETEHLNLNTSDDVTCDTPNGKDNIFGRKLMIDETSTTPELSLSAGVSYLFTQVLTSLTIDAATDSDNETKIYFTAGDGFILTLPAGFDFHTNSLVDEMPIFLEGRKYRISIDNGIFAFSQSSNGGEVSKDYLKQNYLTMQEVYNAFASTYWEIAGASSGQSQMVLNLAVGDNLTNSVVRVDMYTVDTWVNLRDSTFFRRIIKGTPNNDGDYLTIELSIAINGSYPAVKIHHVNADGDVINTVVLLEFSFASIAGTPSRKIITAILQKKSSQLLTLDNIDFGVITEITDESTEPSMLVFDRVDCFFYGSVPIELVNLPYLYSKIGYAAEASIELGEAGDYTSEALWLRSDFVVRELKAVITNGGQIKGVDADKISFNPTTKTVTITINEDLTGWTAQAQVVYDA
ncbi:MAG: hypothetical protein LBL00_04545 [Endomicrobium sp.]|jgi:hypothetical protein|nr:hypothetical protein [Endomicrobium sp.]